MTEVKSVNSDNDTFINQTSNVKIVMKSEYVAIVFIENEFGNKFVRVGDRISKGKLIFKMSYLNINLEFYSPCDCIVDKIFITNNSMIQYGDKIISIVQV